MTTVPMLNTPAPNFSLMASSGKLITLRDLVGQFVVLIFYPVNDSPTCNKQLDDFNLNLDEYVNFGVRVFGVNTAPVDKQRRYCVKRKLDFPILSDPGGVVAKTYGAYRWFFPVNKRTLVVVDPKGLICLYERGIPSADRILAAIKEVEGENSELKVSSN